MPAAVFDDPARRARLDSPAGQYNFLQGGDPDPACPKTSDTYTYGVILQPRFLPKLAMSIDYFDIEIDDTISTVGADTTLKACYFAGRRQSPAARIERNPSNGSLWQGDGNVIDLNTNIGSLSTKGCRPER